MKIKKNSITDDIEDAKQQTHSIELKDLRAQRRETELKRDKDVLPKVLKFAVIALLISFGLIVSGIVYYCFI